MNTPSRRAGALALALSSAILAAVLVSSCDNGSGLFSSIQEETKATTDSVFLKAAVKDLVFYNGNYYSQLVGIYSRSAPGTAATGWTLVSGLGSLGSQYGCRGLVATSTGLYAAIYSRDGGSETPVGIYRLVGSTWTLLMADSTDNIQALYVANDEVYATVMTLSGTTPSYALHYFNGTSLVATDITGLSTRPAGVVSDGTTVWAGAGSNVYRGLASNRLTSTATIALSKTATSITSNGADAHIYVGTVDGYVLHVNDTVVATTRLATSSTSYAVTALAIVPKGAASYLIAGNSYEGYYESLLAAGTSVPDSFQLGSSRLVVASDAADYNTSLEYLPVFALTYDATNKILFAASSATMSTSYPGLWSNIYNGSTAWSGWTAE